MSLVPLTGHQGLRLRLAKAVNEGKLPQVLMLIGPGGVGKQRVGLWLAQRVFCEVPSAGEPCGTCRPCRLVSGLKHPDLHWFVPIPRPKAGDPDKQVEEAAEALAVVMAERRNSPLWTPPDGMAIHGIASARLLSRRVSLTPVEAHRKIVLVGHAERLVPQESSPEAANALLKLLEEPPADTIVILTTEDSQRILPTIRSRAIPIRLGRLSDREVEGFLREYLVPALSPTDLRARVAGAEGAIGRALQDGAGAAKARAAVEALLEAVARGEGARMEAALAQPAFQARGDFAALLDVLAETLGDAAREQAGVGTVRAVPRTLRRRADPARLAVAIGHVQAARDLAQGNVNPQLLLAQLTQDLREVV